MLKASLLIVLFAVFILAATHGAVGTEHGLSLMRGGREIDDSDSDNRVPPKISKKKKSKMKSEVGKRPKTEHSDKTVVKKKKSSGKRNYFDLLTSASKNLAKATKSSVKFVVDRVVVQHVTLQEICGKWRMQQDVEMRKGVMFSCPATFELHADKKVKTFFDDVENSSDFIFKERQVLNSLTYIRSLQNHRSWPGKCTIQFECKAFQGPEDSEPTNMFYKGYFKRSLMNNDVLLMRGKIYRLSGKV